VAGTLLESLAVWGKGSFEPGCPASDVLYDAVAMQMSWSLAPFRMQELRLRVTSKGATVRDGDGKLMDVAMDWADGGLGGFLANLSDDLSAGALPQAEAAATSLATAAVPDLLEARSHPRATASSLLVTAVAFCGVMAVLVLWTFRGGSALGARPRRRNEGRQAQGRYQELALLR